MKNRGCLNVKKQKDIKGSCKYITLDISSEFDSLDKMKISSSNSKGKLEISGKGVDYLSGFKDQSKVAKIQKGKVCHQKFQ